MFLLRLLGIVASFLFELQAVGRHGADCNPSMKIPKEVIPIPLDRQVLLEKLPLQSW
jgi:hypothetical protein